jgi:NAD(P)H-dependent flavin oxidoreductase YrpB (nitropropane dioxygenase family)
MGGVGTRELAAAVAGAGGLGMVPFEAAPAPPGSGINFLMPFVPSPDELPETAGDAGVVEFFYGDPRSDLVEAAHRGGAVVGWQVGSPTEAAAAVEAGCDYVAAQGVEAGGHVRGTQALEEMLAEVLAQVDVPVVAAGGVATAERFAQVMDLGADAVRVGTRFVTCPESGAHPDYVKSLLAASGDDTVLTDSFGEGWEDAPHRVLRDALDAARKTGWRAPVPPHRDIDRSAADMAQYAGTGVGAVTRAEPAADVVADLVRLLDE